MSDWDHRQLCPDGACVGLIGPDGTCKACGRAAPNWGDERTRGMVDAHDDDDDEAEDDDDDYDYEDGDEYEDDEDDDDEPSDDKGIRASADDEGGEWTQRKLCPDGACVGVLGDDNKCKVCGSAP